MAVSGMNGAEQHAIWGKPTSQTLSVGLASHSSLILKEIKGLSLPGTSEENELISPLCNPISLF